MKFICNGCDKPCILDAGDYPELTTDSLRCVVHINHLCKWEKFEDGEVAKLSKLTEEVFNHPNCPEWAKYASINKNGRVIFYSDKTSPGAKADNIGFYDASDWENSLIERPARFPDWAEVGGYVYNDRNGYGKIVSGSVKSCYIEFDGGAGDFVPEAFAELKPARLRPYNAEEIPDLPFEVTERNSNFRTTIVSCRGNKVWLAGASTAISTEELMRDFTAKGEPCGILEHLEDGEWVK